MRKALFVATVAMVGAACGSRAGSVTSPSSVPVTVTRSPDVRIGGLEGYPTFLVTGQFPLTATLAKADGSPDVDCTASAQWTSDDPTVVRMTGYWSGDIGDPPPGNTLNVYEEGRTNVRATCAGVTGVLPVTVSHYELRGIVSDSDGRPMAGARVKIGRPTSLSSTGPATVTGPDGSYSIASRFDPVAVEASHDGYEFSTVASAWNRAASMTADVALRAVALLTQGEGRLCNVLASEPGYAECQVAGVTRRDEAVYFRVPRDGQIVIRTFWPGPSAAGEFISDLQCSGQTIHNYRESNGLGLGYAIDATTACTYDLVLSNRTEQRILPYRYTIEIR